MRLHFHLSIFFSLSTCRSRDFTASIVNSSTACFIAEPLLGSYLEKHSLLALFRELILKASSLFLKASIVWSSRSIPITSSLSLSRFYQRSDTFDAQTWNNFIRTCSRNLQTFFRISTDFPFFSFLEFENLWRAIKTLRKWALPASRSTDSFTTIPAFSNQICSRTSVQSSALSWAKQSFPSSRLLQHY